MADPLPKTLADPKLLMQASVSAAYPLFMVLTAVERGIAAERVLAGSGLSQPQLMASNARVSALQQLTIATNLLRETGDPGIALEMGLRGSLTKLGMMGFGLMSCATYREAVELGCRYLPTVVSFFSARFSVAGGTGIVDVTETLPLGPLRRFAFEIYMAEAFEVYRWLLSPEQTPGGGLLDRGELWLDFPEPPYFERFRARMPRVRFGAPANQLRFDAALLDLPLRTANPLTAQLAIEQCERELAKLGYTESLLDRVRAFLVCRNGRYPDLDTVADRLHVSTRTLKRRLAAHGLGFAGLLDEVRKRDSLRLLDDPRQSIEAVALRVGYTDPANFTRAFRKWTGETPTAYRSRHPGSVPLPRIGGEG